MIVYLIKSKNGALYASDEDARKYIKRRKPGQIIKADIKQEHNYEFFKKMWALFKTVHDNLPEPEQIEFMGKKVTPIQTLDATRKYLIVKAGYYNIIGYPNGSVRVEAKSISYSKMEPEEFEKLYSDVIDAALKTLPSDWSDEKINQVANAILRFD